MRLRELKEYKEFEGRSTSTKNKDKATEWALGHSGGLSGGGFCVYLVGSSDGLLRHIEDKVRLGFVDPSKHIIVERGKSTCRALEKQKRFLAKKIPALERIEVRCEDILQVAKSFPHGTIEHLDFDTASAFTERMANSVTELANLGIRNIHAVFDQRSGSSYLKKDVA